MATGFGGALKDCIGMLEKFSKESDEARKTTKHDAQQYSSDMNLLGSFVQSLQGRMAATYHTDKKNYEQLRSKQHKGASAGFIQRHQTKKAAKRFKNHVHSRKQKVKRKKAHRKASKAKAHKTLSHHGHGTSKHRHGRWQAPSFLQLSQDEHAELTKVDQDLRKLQASLKKQMDMADQQAQAAEAAQGMLNHLGATSLLQLSEGDGELAENSQEGEAEVASSLLEEEAPSFASLFWKPWKLDEKQTLHHIVGFGLTKDAAHAQKIAAA